MDMNLGKLWEDSEGHVGLACCRPWGHKESDMTEWVNNNLTLIDSISWLYKAELFF